MQFCLGYDPMEFNWLPPGHRRRRDRRQPAHHGGEVALDGVAGAFDALGNPGRAPCKILVTPNG